MEHMHHEKMNPKETTGTKKVDQKYTCPMHPQVIQNGPGTCPICGMKLVPLKKSGAEHHDHHTMINDFRKRFFIALALTIPIMLLSEMIQHWLNIYIAFTGSKYVLLLLSSIVFFYCGNTDNSAKKCLSHFFATNK